MSEGYLASYLDAADAAMSEAYQLQRTNLETIQAVLAAEAAMMERLDKIQGIIVSLVSQLDEAREAEVAINETMNEMVVRSQGAVQKAEVSQQQCDHAQMELDMNIGINELDGLGGAIAEAANNLRDRLAVAKDKVVDARQAAELVHIHTVRHRQKNHAACLVQLPSAEVVDAVKGSLTPIMTRLQYMQGVDPSDSLQSAIDQAGAASDSVKAVIQ